MIKSTIVAFTPQEFFLRDKEALEKPSPRYIKYWGHLFNPPESPCSGGCTFQISRNSGVGLAALNYCDWSSTRSILHQLQFLAICSYTPVCLFVHWLRHDNMELQKKANGGWISLFGVRSLLYSRTQKKMLWQNSRLFIFFFYMYVSGLICLISAGL